MTNTETTTATGTPAADSSPRWRMPSETAPHDRVYMAFPSRGLSFGDAEDARRAWAAVAHATQDFVPVTMVVDPDDRAAAEAMLTADIELLTAPLDDAWMRDIGPTFVIGDGVSPAATVSGDSSGVEGMAFDANGAATGVLLSCERGCSVTASMVSGATGEDAPGECGVLAEATVGIHVDSVTSALVQGNRVSAIAGGVGGPGCCCSAEHASGGPAAGVLLSDAIGARVIDNRIEALAGGAGGAGEGRSQPGGTGGLAIGIDVDDSTDCTLADNEVVGAGGGPGGDGGQEGGCSHLGHGGTGGLALECLDCLLT